MTFMITAQGDEVDLRYPRPPLQLGYTIGWHLAQTNRFSGAAHRPYSVAEHSLLVCEIAERELHLPPAGLMLALAHDAHKAFVGDQATPQKREIGAAWDIHEMRWQRIVRGWLNLHTATLNHGAAVHTADLMALASEKEALLTPTPTPWPVLLHVPPVRWAVVDLQMPERTTHDWEFWRDRWLDRFHELTEALNEGRHPVNQPE